MKQVKMLKYMKFYQGEIDLHPKQHKKHNPINGGKDLTSFKGFDI